LTRPALGRIVHYRVTTEEAEATRRRRQDFLAFNRKHNWLPEGQRRISGEPGATGHQAHYGSHVEEGDTFPAIMTYVGEDGAWVNLQVFLDGNDSLYVIDPEFGDEPGQWSWPLDTE